MKRRNNSPNKGIYWLKNSMLPNIPKSFLPTEPIYGLLGITTSTQAPCPSNCVANFSDAMRRPADIPFADRRSPKIAHTS